MIKLSIIIPVYQAEPYIHELLNILEQQINEEVQVILIDDFSNPKPNLERPWLKLLRNDRNRGISYSRNRGLELAEGELIHFLDADDMVPENYVEYIFNLLATKDFDYIDLSWKTLPGGYQHDYKLINDDDALPNPSASTRIFRRSFIGDVRFNENKDAAEDEQFTRNIGIKSGKRICATEYMYFYRISVPNSNSKRYLKKQTRTKRIVYHYNHVTKYMQWLLREIKREDETNEVVLLTEQNDIPELEKYCQIMKPDRMVWAVEARGEPTDLIWKG